MERIFNKQLLDWKNSGMVKPLLVLGARQVGKTYAVDAFCKQEFTQYHKVNLFEDVTLKQIYKSDLNSAAKFEQLQLLIGAKLNNTKSILFVDEVQESEEFIANLKYLQEQHPKANIICAGSLLGVKLKRLNASFPVGKVTLKNLYPMSFQEFLMAVGKSNYVSTIQQCFSENTKMLAALHEELLYLYRIYLCIGGMPELVQQYLDGGQDLTNIDRSFFEDLKIAYLNDMKKYVQNLNEAIKIERMYQSIPTQQANRSHKFQYSKVRSGARANQYETALDWLIAAGLVHKSQCVSKPTSPLPYYAEPNVFKLFLHDVGALTHALGIAYSDVVLDRLGQAKGWLAESYVATELKVLGKNLNYWRSDFEAEIDFLQDVDGAIIPLEVKAADNVQSKSLSTYRKKYQPKQALRLSTKNFGLEGGIKSVPLYAAFCL